MKFNNYHGFAAFTVIDNNQLYTLREKKTGHNVISGFGLTQI